jgi:tRNA pseudouridine55 synthase
MFGFLNLFKPPGFTSHDCVNKVRRILNIKKVGHGGTLDPLATGVLPIAVGKATRLLPFLSTHKAYHAKIRFGLTTTTDDLEGEIISTQSASDLTLETVQSYLPNFVGIIDQIPPAFSAIKKDGKKLYQLARKGQYFDIPKRQVEISKIDILAWNCGEFPELDLAIFCGSGTYIRSIARDLGTMLQVGGTLAGLTRTLSCGMELANSLTFEQINTQQEKDEFKLIFPELLLQHLPKIYLSEPEAKRWCQGQKINYLEVLNTENCLIFQEETQEFLGIGIIKKQDGETIIKPDVVVGWAKHD